MTTRSEAASRADLVLATLDQLTREHGYAPSIREMMEHTGFSGTGVVWYWLRELRYRGLVTRTRKGMSRGYAVTAAGRKALKRAG